MVYSTPSMFAGHSMLCPYKSMVGFYVAQAFRPEDFRDAARLRFGGAARRSRGRALDGYTATGPKRLTPEGVSYIKSKALIGRLAPRDSPATGFFS
jgi:hypothetical protein